MFEKVNPSHPDKLADRIAGALVDLAYNEQPNPKVAVEVLLGHGKCHIINETSCKLSKRAVKAAVYRIVRTKKVKVDYVEVKQDENLAHNQVYSIHCGDNGIFKGMPVTSEQKDLTNIAKSIYKQCPFDGKYILDRNHLIICQSNMKAVPSYGKKYKIVFNPLGYWTGGIDVDSGATNRKLGSDMGDSITGGGLHGKDLSKADVSVNIYAFLSAQELQKPVECVCAIGDDKVKVVIDDSVKLVNYSEIVIKAKNYIRSLGGFEKFAEYGLIR